MTASGAALPGWIKICGMTDREAVAAALEAGATPGAEGDIRLPDVSLGMQVTQALRPLTPLLAAAAFAVTAMTLVGSLLVA